MSLNDPRVLPDASQTGASAETPFIDPYHEETHGGAKQYVMPFFADLADPLYQVQKEPLTDADVISIRYELLQRSIHALADDRTGPMGRADILAWILRKDPELYGTSDPFSFPKCCYQEGLDPVVMQERLFNNYVDLHVDSMLRGFIYEWLFDPIEAYPDDMTFEECCIHADFDSQTLKQLILTEQPDKHARSENFVRGAAH